MKGASETAKRYGGGWCPFGFGQTETILRGGDAYY